MEAGLGPDEFVLDGDPAPPPCETGTAAPSFRSMSVVAMVIHVSYCWGLVIVWQTQKNFRVKGKKLYFGFADLEKKAFDRVAREV